MITFDLVQRIHRTIDMTCGKEHREEYILIMKSMYPEAFVETDITSMVRFEYYRQTGFDIKYRGKKIGKIEIRINQLSDVTVKDDMNYGFKMAVDNYGLKIIMFGSLETYNLEFFPEAKDNRIKETQ